MNINVKRTSGHGAGSRYMVEVDGDIMAADADYQSLPFIIDRIYSSREDLIADKLLGIAEDMTIRAGELKKAAEVIDAQAAEVMQIYNRIWEERLRGE